MATNPTSEPIRRSGGLDVLRLGAMLLVTTQHALSLTGHDRWATVRSLNLGQLGVAIFFGISALLAGSSRRLPNRWLARRLVRLYPAYWLAMIACFAAARIGHYKQYGIWQFLSQMIGIGIFTHPQTLINVPTWFISILLVCYIAIFVVKASQRPLLANMLLVAAIVTWSASSGFGFPWMHFLTFFLTSALAIACPGEQRSRGLLAAGFAVLLLAPWSAAYAYTALTLLLIGAASGVSAVPRLITRVADLSYEYYLVHGPLLLLTTSALRSHPVIAVACGTLLAASGAVLLRRIADRGVSTLVRRAKGSPPPQEGSGEAMSLADSPTESARRREYRPSPPPVDLGDRRLDNHEGKEGGDAVGPVDGLRDGRVAAARPVTEPGKVDPPGDRPTASGWDIGEGLNDEPRCGTEVEGRGDS